MATIQSTVYTIGTALRRAEDADIPVELLLSGQWLGGKITAQDGYGVVLHSNDGQLSIIRLASVDAVRVGDAANFEGREVEARHDESPDFSDISGDQEAHPMPAGPSDRG